MIEYHLVPNWAEGVKETYEFKTTIFTTRSGKEQRTAERLKPRRSVAFQGWVRGAAMRALQGLLHDRGAAAITIPDPARYGLPLSRDADVGASVLILKEGAPWVEDTANIAISSWDETEFLTAITRIRKAAYDTGYDNSYDIADEIGVGSYNGEFAVAFDVSTRKRLVLTTSLTRAWAAGSVVRPAITGRLQKQVTVSYPTSDLMIYNADVALDPPSEPPTLLDEVPPRFLGLPVFDVSPNWSTAPQVQFSSPFEEVDYGRGVARHFLPVEFYTRISQLNFLGRSREDIGKLLNLFCEARGRQGEFWCPTWIEDLVPAGPIVLNSDTMLVDNDAQRYRLSTVNRAVMLVLDDGRKIYRSILGMQAVTVGGVVRTRIRFGQSFGIAAAQNRIVMMCWLHRSRFAVDALTIDWRSDDVAQTVAQIMSLEVLD